MCGIVLAIEPDYFNYTHLEPLIQCTDPIIHSKYPRHRLIHRTMCQKHKRIALARSVAFGSQERLHEFWRVGDKVLELAVDGVDREDCVLAHVRVTVLEASET
jgi:hypothetical protein